MPVPKISAIVCTYNRYDLLPRALKSLQSQSLSEAEFEIIVVDNSPNHDLSKKISARFGGISNLTWVIETTPGLSNGRNVGIRHAAGEIVSFIDDDAVAEPDWLASIIECFERFGERAVVLGGRVKPLWAAPRPRWLHDDLLGYLSVVDWGGSARIAGEREWFAGTNISFRRSALVATNGFSVDLGRNRTGASLLSNDEIELIAKIKEIGGLLIYEPSACVSHHVEPERLTQSWFRRRAAWQATSDYILESQRLFEQATESWGRVMWFVNQLAPRDRSMRALCMPIEDPELFRGQVFAIYDYTVVILAGFNNIEI